MAAFDDATLDTLFRNARSHNGWEDRPITDAQIHQIYDLMKFGPTSANISPARLVWCRSPEARERLAVLSSGSNGAKIRKASATVIIGYDLDFPDHMIQLFPHAPEARDWFPPPVRQETAFRNSTLQGAYLIMAARAVGLNVGPMSGFDNAKVDAEFFAGTNVKSNFICSIGYGTEEGLFQRLPRLPFDDANKIL